MISLAINTSAPPPYIGYESKQAVTADGFPQRLAELRKQHSLTQAQLAERIGMHVVQLRQPTLNVLRLHFEAVSRFDEEEKRVVRSLGMILKHEARRWQNVSNGGERK